MFGRACRFALWLSAWALPPARAQQVPSQLPTGVEIERLLANPQAGEAIRRRIERSGLTPEQIRTRLQAAGYSPSLLDPYLRAAPGGRLVPSDSVVQAVSLLGLGEVDELQAYADSIRRAAAGAPVLAAESAGADSLPGLRLFGLNVFSQPTTQFLPDLAGPVDENYRLGPGDVLVVILTGDVELSHTLEVTREGFVVIPQVGQVIVNNLTMGQARTVLRNRLGQAYSAIRDGTAQFDLTVGRVRMVQVYVVGEVRRPGSYQIPSVSTVLTALYQAGGPTGRANFRGITIRRGADTVGTLDLYDYLLRGAARGDIRIQSGDVVFVPVHGTRVSIAGAVVRPAVYELTRRETLRELVQAAGGFRADAALRRIGISRIVPPGQRAPGAPDRIAVDVPLAQVEDGLAPSFPLEPGDSVSVFAVDDTRRAVVDVQGAVYLPGRFAWRPGLTLSEVLQLAGGLRPAVYAGRAHIERLNPADSTRYLVDVRLPADSSEPFPNDIELWEYDVVTVYGREEFREDRTVAISGMVNRPGAYPFRNGMTLKDLVLMARGVRDGAYLDSAEIARLPADRSVGTLAIRLRVPLDSSYLFEPENTTYPRLPGLPTTNGTAPDVPLEPFDQVTILRQPEFELQRMVEITGEVRFEGTYALTHRDERVSDLVQRAGGLLPTAYPEGARFTRRLDNAGRVNLELARALERRGSRQDIVLQPGDSLHVPEFVPTVRVTGAVVSPTSVLYRQGAGLGYYIDNAGGWAAEADEGRTSVRYANGSARTRSKFLFFSSWPQPGPGSTVFVPARPPGDRFDVAGLVTGLVSVLGSITTVIVVLTR